MKTSYIDIPQYTTIAEIENKNFSMSATQYKTLCINNKNIKTVADFLDRDLNRNDLGSEVGSENYIKNTGFRFIKTKALQQYSYLLENNSESVIEINPKIFKKMKLQKGDLLISKDSNVGEIVILDEDLPDTMLCGGLYKLPITKNKYYLLAFIKSQLFRQQIDFLVPKGSTIRHGKTKFLECLIPMPNYKVPDTIKYIETIMEAIIEKEILIRKRHYEILKNIDKELINNQHEHHFQYVQPSISSIEKVGRLDSSIYSLDFQKNNFLVKNYKFGSVNLIDRGYEGVRGTSLENNFIKTRIDSDHYIDGFYNLIIPTNISEYGYVQKSTYIGTKATLKTISKGDIVFGGEGFGKGRTFVVCEDSTNVATNYHGIRIINNNHDLEDSIFIRCFLAYWREKGMIDKIGVGGSGGHCAPSYFHMIETPKFPKEQKQLITKLYYSNVNEINVSDGDFNRFIELNKQFNAVAGIYELDKSIKHLQQNLNNAINNIVNDMQIDFKF